MLRSVERGGYALRRVVHHHDALRDPLGNVGADVFGAEPTPDQRKAFEIPGPDAKSLATVFIGSTRRNESGSCRKPWAE